jgi:hypothetical protein
LVFPRRKFVCAFCGRFCLLRGKICIYNSQIFTHIHAACLCGMRFKSDMPASSDRIFAFAVIVCYCHRYYLAARVCEIVSSTKRDHLRHSYQLCHLRRRRNEFSKNESRYAWVLVLRWSYYSSWR